MLLDVSSAPVEDRFHTELRLLLGPDATVQEGPPAFASLPAGVRLDALRQAVANGATVVWLEPETNDLLRASVAVLGPDRAEVRVVDIPKDHGAEAVLALAVRTVMGTRFDTAPPPPPPDGPPPEPAVATRVGASATGTPQADLRGGVLVAPSWPLGDRLWAGARVDAQAGPAGVWLQAGPSLSKGHVHVDAHISLVRHSFGTWLRPGVRGGMAWPLTPHTDLGLQLTVLPLRDVVLRDGQGVYDSGRVELSAVLTRGGPRG